MRKHSKQSCIDLAKKIVRESGDTCERCHKQSPVFHAAHIMPVTYAATCADLDNLLRLCPSCHSVGPKSSHQNPASFGIWLNDEFPGRYERLEKKAHGYAKNKLKIDWNEVWEELKLDESTTLLD